VTLAGIGIVQTIVYLLFIRGIDLYEREPLRYVIPVFVWGFTVAVGLSIVFEMLFSLTVSSVTNSATSDFLGTVVGAPVIEECAKGLALLVVFGVAVAASRRKGAIEFSGIMDGIVYGSAVGFGFSIAEDLVYYANFGGETFVMRRILGGFAHAAYTSVTGVAFGLVPWVRSRALKILLPVLGLCGAILIHALHNGVAYFFGALAYGVEFPIIIVYIVLVAIWLGIERRTIRTELRDEVDTGIISPREFAILPTYFARTRYYLGLVFSGRMATWLRARKAHGKMVDLAFTKRLSRNAHAAPDNDSVRRLRQRIGELKGAAPAQRAP
jgi:RsiW-degrading membrane proteinase PrsW (M82 family)